MNRSFHRRNLPHLYYNDGIYFITFRLKDSIPLKLLKELRLDSNQITENESTRILTSKELRLSAAGQKRIFRKYDSLLDTGRYGEKLLTLPQIIKVVKHTLHFPDGKDYLLICYCIMPNHVHIVIKLLNGSRSISKIMQSIKRISARDCNRILHRRGKFWQEESFDRLVRDETELYNILKYVLTNPVKAGLVNTWDEWEHTYCRRDFLIL